MSANPPLPPRPPHPPGQYARPPRPFAPPAHPHTPPVHAYAPPYSFPAPRGTAPYGAAPAPRRHGGALGAVALVLAIVAAIGASAVGAVAAWEVGVGAGRGLAARPTAEFDWSVLIPVREWVLVGEVALWVGTALGIWAFTQGIVAIVKDRGRVAAIIAVVVAGLGPVIFFVGVQLAFMTGFGAGG